LIEQQCENFFAVKAMVRNEAQLAQNRFFLKKMILMIISF